MKCLVIIAVCVAVATAAFPHQKQARYQPQASGQVFKRAPAPQRATAGSDQEAEIVSYESDISPDGVYRYSYQTNNGIAAEEQGSASGAQGNFAYTSPEGQPISVTYTADENGFQPQGDHLPVAPPVPEAIARALKWIASQPPQKKK